MVLNKTIVQGKVAVVCLAGNSWLHAEEEIPVGMIDIGLPSGKTLFQLQAERLRRIQAMAQRMQEGSRKTRYASVATLKVNTHEDLKKAERAISCLLVIKCN